MSDKQERKIGDCTYVVSTLGAKQARKVQFRLVKMLGPATAGLVKAESVAAAVGSALQTFSSVAQEDDLEYLYDAFASVTTVKKPIVSTSGSEITLSLEKVFDTHFRGHTGYMNLWLAFAIEVNFSSFFDEITSGGNLFAAFLVEKEKEKPTSE